MLHISYIAAQKSQIPTSDIYVAYMSKLCDRYATYMQHICHIYVTYMLHIYVTVIFHIYVDLVREVTFSGEIFFPSKVPEFLHVLFN